MIRTLTIIAFSHVVNTKSTNFVQIDIGTSHYVIIKGPYSIDGITEDPKDDMFIACALEERADYIISRDPHLRNIKHFQRIQVVDVTTFIEKVKKR